MKKLSLTALLEAYYGPYRPDGEAPTNRHYDRQPRSYRYQYYPLSGHDYPYLNQKNDLDKGKDVVDAEEDESIDDEIDEEVGLSELFYFGQSAKDNTSLPGNPDLDREEEVLGKSSDSIASYDPSFKDTSPEKTRQRRQTVKGREFSKVDVPSRKDVGVLSRNPFGETIEPSMKFSYDRAKGDYSTKNPFENGLPRHNQPWDPQTELEKEEEDIENYLKREGYQMDPVSDHGRLSNTKRLNNSKSDLYSLDDEDELSEFLMNTEEDMKDR